MEEENKLIDVKGLVRRFGKQYAVKNINFSLKKGEVLGFLGPNGAGKSTTMKILCGILAPTAGEISVAGIDLLAKPKEAKRHIGFLSEVPYLYFDDTVTEYLTHCAKLKRVEKKDLILHVTEAFEKCGLHDVANRLIGNLSKGYRQRVGLAQAIIHKPQILILDEPTAGLDPGQIVDVRELILSLKDDVGIIFSSHILPEVENICDRVQIINKGEIVYRADDIKSQKRKLCLVFDELPSESELDILPGKKEVVIDSKACVYIDNGASEIDRGLLLQAACEHKWLLSEMYDVKGNLEKVYLNLTRY